MLPINYHLPNPHAVTTRSAAGSQTTRRSGRRRRHDDSLITDVDGYHRDFGYDIMRRLSRKKEETHTPSWVARQARMEAAYHNGARLGDAVPRDDLVHQLFLLPDGAPAAFADPHEFWTELQNRKFGPNQHMWAGPTIWFDVTTSWHVAARHVRDFIQFTVVDRLNVPAHMFVHDPALLGKYKGPHVHVMISAQRVDSQGIAGFVPELVEDGCQSAMEASWSAYKAFKGI